MRARHDDSIDTLRAREYFGKNLERSSTKSRTKILELHPEAQVGLVDAETFHRLGIWYPQKWRLYLDAENFFEHRSHHALGHAHDVLGPRAGHLDIDLGELGLAVGAQIFVPKASRDLEVAI